MDPQSWENAEFDSPRALFKDWKAAKKWFKKKPFRYDLISDADPKCFIPDPAFEFSEFRIRIQSDPDPDPTHII